MLRGEEDKPFPVASMFDKDQRDVAKLTVFDLKGLGFVKKKLLDPFSGNHDNTDSF